MSGMFFAAAVALWVVTVIALAALIKRWRSGLYSVARAKPDRRNLERDIRQSAEKLRQKGSPALKASMDKLGAAAVLDEKTVKTLVKKWLSEKEGDKLEK